MEIKKKVVGTRMINNCIHTFSGTPKSERARRVSITYI